MSTDAPQASGSTQWLYLIVDQDLDGLFLLRELEWAFTLGAEGAGLVVVREW